MKLSKLIFSVFAVTTLAGSMAQAHRNCSTDCWYDRWGGRHCRTVCHDHHHPNPPVVIVDPDKEDLAISASLLAISAISIALDNKSVALVQASEDAAAFIETGRMTGTLAALVQSAREEAAKLRGVDEAAALTEAELVDGILAAAEKALEQS